ncbi:DUF1987 domain-containing protein [Carboxylicivirga sp. M1479]|uniref:DUF1987 domain-containing protein n=1 Tax=Carboxylicivirga sp. M1479 TaxID=2594476 RepID=UPI0011782D60|nr:DUF1987 domain-containing protein [Carboxylicivirga sp. M1479]TRX70972.1 DUF1987 domain-containing protein [Carboxylicivirga sp. M1479]
MKPLVKEATPKTPYLNFNATNGYFQIAGKSIPENPHNLFDPILEWLDDYTSNPLPETKVDIKLEYFNTSSSVFLLSVLKKLKALYKEGYETNICWYCDKKDDDMIEAGEDYQSIIDIPIKIIEV